MKSPKSIFTCQNCGYQAPKWMGKCPDCGEWHTLVEEVQQKGSFQPGGSAAIASFDNEPIPIDSVKIADVSRISTRIEEFDRVLGGGLVPGSMVLIGGDPGIGKSTLMLQVIFGLAGQGLDVFYVSGEESIAQLSMRSKRLSTVSPHIWVVSEINMEMSFFFSLPFVVSDSAINRVESSKS